MLDHHVVAIVRQRAIDVIDPRDSVEKIDGISDAVLEIKSVHIRLELLSEFIDAFHDVRMVACELFEHADHVVLISIHEALGVHLGFAHRQQV